MNHVSHPFNSANISVFCQWKLTIFVLSENTVIGCILVHNFNFLNIFQIFKYFLNRHSYNFDDISKIEYSRPSQDKDILE